MTPFGSFRWYDSMPEAPQGASAQPTSTPQTPSSSPETASSLLGAPSDDGGLIDIDISSSLDLLLDVDLDVGVGVSTALDVVGGIDAAAGGPEAAVATTAAIASAIDVDIVNTVAVVQDTDIDISIGDGLAVTLPASLFSGPAQAVDAGAIASALPGGSVGLAADDGALA